MCRDLNIATEKGGGNFHLYAAEQLVVSPRWCSNKVLS